MCIWITVYCHLLSAYRTSFRISEKAILLATHSLSFSLSLNAFISPSFLKHSFTGDKISNWEFYISAHHIMLFHYFPVYIVSDENQIFVVPLHVMSYVFLTAFKMLSLALALIILTMICLFIFILFGSSLSLLEV